MKNLIVLISLVMSSTYLVAQSAQIIAAPSNSTKQTSEVTIAATDLDVAKTEADAVNKLLKLSPEQYSKVYNIYVEKNTRIEAAKVTFANNAQYYTVEVSIASNSADQYVAQQLNNEQMPKWMDAIRAKHNSKK